MTEAKEKVLCDVAAMFMKYGIRSVSMDDIAHQQGISKKTIYQYFTDKNDLVNQVTHMVLADRTQQYACSREEVGNAIEELFAMSKLIRRHFKEINPALLYDLQKYHPEGWAVFLKHEQDVVYHMVADNLKRGIAEGYFRSGINVNILAKFRVEQIHLSLDERLFPKDQFDLTEVQMQLFDHYVHGILTEAGLKLYQNYQNESNE